MSAKTNLMIDAAILAVFLVVFEPALTGIAVHEWLSLALAGMLIVHMALHWDWVVKVTVQFFRNLLHPARLNYIVDAILLIAFVMAMLSGILISRSILNALGIQLTRSPTWRFIHAASADLVLWMVALHFALHWKWIVRAFKCYVVDSLKRSLAPQQSSVPAVMPVASSVSISSTQICSEEEEI